MTPERWTRIEDLFRSAIERDPAGRAAFLAEACGADRSLRLEVESLLAADGEAGSFLETARTPGATLAPGRRLGPYEVAAMLGSGGMGEVYRARDARLGRDVAIKVVSRATSGQQEKGRLEREARAAGALNHPNILAVYDVGEEDGLFYIVSELLEGEPLRAHLNRGPPLPTPRYLDFARQVAHGLAAAHQKGIVHRDIKPENLFVTLDGRVKILDFGLAKRLALGAPPGDTAAQTETRPGMILGTPGYMSPEQVQGEPVGPRSDLFSLGAVLYEMLSGRRPFGRGSTLDVLHATVREEPPPLGDGVSPALASLVEHCLAKDPGARFQSARELCDALDPLAGATAGEARRAVLEQRKSVAVLPFRDLGSAGDSEHLGLGLADATITELSQLRSLLVRSTSAILRYQREPVDPQQAGRELSVDAVVDGSFQRSGAQLRITVRVVSSRDGRSLWARKIDASLDDVFRMQDEVSRSIARALEVELTSSDEERLDLRVRAAAPPGKAYELYLKGRVPLLRGNFGELLIAIDWFEKACQADPGFAPAWAGIAAACSRVAFEVQTEGDWYERAVAMCDKALALDPNLPEGRYVRGYLAWSSRGGFNHALAIRECAAAIASRPSLDDAYVRLGTVLQHVGLIEEAVSEFERALAISPDHAAARYMIGFCRHHQGRYHEALQISESVARDVPSSWIHYQLAFCQLRVGRIDEARSTVDLMNRQLPGDLLGHPILGLIAALRGDPAEALKETQLISAARRDLNYYHHAQYDVACIQVLLGNASEAISWLEQAAHNGYPCHPLFAADPLLAPLRGNERYQRLIDWLRDERDRYARLFSDLRRTASAPLLAAPKEPEQQPTSPPARRSPIPWHLAGRAAAGLSIVAALVALVLSWIRHDALPQAPRNAASVAVLPFANVGAAKDDEYLATGIHSELIAQLAQVSGLRVIARTSVQSYRNTAKSPGEIGKELGVASLLEGSVQRAGNRVRVTAHLIDAKSGQDLWAERYDRDLADLFAIQTEVAQDIAGKLGAQLTPGERVRLARPPTRNAEAYDYYLRGLEYWQRTAWDIEGIKLAAAAFEKAVAADTGFALAHARLGIAWTELYFTEADKEAASAVTARAEIDRALALQPDLPDAHFALGHYLYHQRDYPAALREYEVALRGAPGNAELVAHTGQVARRQGRWDEALAQLQRAVLIDPRFGELQEHLADTLCGRASGSLPSVASRKRCCRSALSCP